MNKINKPTAKLKITGERIVKKVDGKWVLLKQNKWVELTDATVRKVLEQHFRA